LERIYACALISLLYTVNQTLEGDNSGGFGYSVLGACGIHRGLALISLVLFRVRLTSLAYGILTRHLSRLRIIFQASVKFRGIMSSFSSSSSLFIIVIRA